MQVQPQYSLHDPCQHSRPAAQYQKNIHNFYAVPREPENFRKEQEKKYGSDNTPSWVCYCPTNVSIVIYLSIFASFTAITAGTGLLIGSLVYKDTSMAELGGGLFLGGATSIAITYFATKFFVKKLSSPEMDSSKTTLFFPGSTV